jgi:outer membrane protein
MKKSLLTVAILVGVLCSASAQKFCYVDLEYILNKIPSYTEAQKQLDKVSEGYQKEIDNKRKNVEAMFKSYQAEQVLMTEQMKQQKIKELEAAEKEVIQLKTDKFGPSGALFKKRQELIKPIQDKLYDEIQKYAQAKAYDFILDKSSGPSMLYANEKFNKSDDILANMGINKK